MPFLPHDRGLPPAAPCQGDPSVHAATTPAADSRAPCRFRPSASSRGPESASSSMCQLSAVALRERSSKRTSW